MLQYWLLSIITITILIFLYIRLKFRFWSIQPVFHIYDINHWLITDKVIDSELPRANKYVKLLDIDTFSTKELSHCEKKDISEFICDNFIHSSLADYSPTEDDIFPYFNTNIGKSYVSMFLDNIVKPYDIAGTISRKRDIIGVIMSRPLFVSFSGKAPMTINYIDNLTVRSDRRKEGVAPILIQTHQYQISHFNPYVNVCIFKREGDMTAIVPLTLYMTKEFNIVDICAKRVKLVERLVKIDKSNFIHFKSIVKTCLPRFACTLNMELTTLFELIMLSKIVIYVLINGISPICCYVLRRTPFVAEGRLNCIELISTINCAPFIDIFFAGFQTACRRESRKNKIQRIIMEETGDTCSLVCEMKKHSILCKTECPTAFFLYNYAHYSIQPEHCFFIY